MFQSHFHWTYQIINELGSQQVADCNYCVNGLLLSYGQAVTTGHGLNNIFEEILWTSEHLNDQSLTHAKHPHTVCLYFLSWKWNVNKTLLLAFFFFYVNGRVVLTDDLNISYEILMASINMPESENLFHSLNTLDFIAQQPHWTNSGFLAWNTGI